MTVEETLDFLKSRMKALGYDMTLVLIEGGQFTNYAKAREVPSNNSELKGTVITVSMPDRELYYLRGWDIEFNVPINGRPGVTGRPKNIREFLGEMESRREMTNRDNSLPLYRKSARGGSTIPPDLNYRTGWEYEGLRPKRDAKPVAQAIVNRMHKPSILVNLYHRRDCRLCKKREIPGEFPPTAWPSVGV